MVEVDEEVLVTCADEVEEMMMQATNTKGCLDMKAVVTAPLSLDSDESNSKYRAPNIVKRILSLFSNVRPGSDLTRFKLPAQFNLPKSQLQTFGESLYCINYDVLSKCANEETPLSRFVSVVAWSISTLRPLVFGVIPYNPILGETHHVSRGTLNVMLEQVSHHPPVTALQATDEKDSTEIIWCQAPVPKFYGTHVEVEVQGKQQLKLLNKNETYTMNSPKVVIRFLPVPGIHWFGNVRIRCEQTGLEAALCYKGNSILARSSILRSVEGKIFVSSTKETIYEINGQWDRIVTAKDVGSGKTTVIYNGKEALSGLKTPFVKDPKGVSKSESVVVWSEVSGDILQQNWEKANEAKNLIEEKQREVARERKSVQVQQDNWAPKYFTISHSKESGWSCEPINKVVPPAPIVVNQY